ncbi:MAG: NFACT RNA binding domain-containing protein [Anaerovorax sp.]
MSFDGMVTGAIAHELNRKLTGGKIEKIYQPESTGVILLIHANRQHYMLYLSAGSSHARMHLITEKDTNPQNPSGFCMLMRKHIQGGRISSILQKDSERIVEISVETVNELGFSISKKMVVEIMGKHSNIVIVDAISNKILDSIKRISMDVNRYRQLLPGLQYVYPPTQEKQSYYDLTCEEIENFLIHSKESEEIVPVSKVLLDHIQGISPLISVEISEHGSHASSIFQTLEKLVKSIEEEDFSPCVYIDPSKIPVDFHIFPISALEKTYEKLSFETANEAAEYYYLNKKSSNIIRQKSSDLERALKSNLDKLILKRKRLFQDIEKAENSEIYRLHGELLTANLHLIKPGDSSVTVLNYYDNTPLEIQLNVRLSPSQNAQSFYKRYGKSKTAIKEKNIQLEETSKDIAYLESVLSYIESATSSEEIEELRLELIEGGYMKRRKNTYKPSKSKPMPHHYTTDDGFRVFVGKNNKENDVLTFKTAAGKDLWLHTKDIPGSHTILFSDGKPFTEESIFQAASMAAFHSKGRSSENVPVDYTQVRYVKKPSGAKPGMVIFTNNKTIYVNPKVPQPTQRPSK